MKNMHLITVLNDGDTWTNAVGTKVMVLKEDDFHTVFDNGLKPETLAFQSFDLTNPAHLRALALFIESGRR